MSKIFNWYRNDLGGDLILFISKYMEDEDKAIVDRILTGELTSKIVFEEYDWTLNSA